MNDTAAQALADQADAAATDARRRLEVLAAAHGSAPATAPVPLWLVPHVRRLTSAVKDRTGSCCPHIGPAPSVACAAVWDPGHLTCLRCTWRLSADGAEDSTCDRCRTYADPIHPGAVALGPVLLVFGLCLPCRIRTYRSALVERDSL